MTPPELTATNLDWMHQFVPGSNLHIASVVGGLAWIVGGTFVGVCLRRTVAARSFEIFLGWMIIFVQLYALVWRWLPGQFELHEALPLHLCRIVSWVCAIAFITQARWAISLAFFWGLGLSTMGLITPVIRTGPVTIEYWLFWLAHAQIVGTAVYFIVVYGWGPTRRDWVLAAVASLGYVALIAPFNWLVGTDYGYLGSGGSIAYDRSTLAGHLGAYPLRVLWILVLAEIWLAFLYLVAYMVHLIKHARMRSVSS